MAKKGFDPACVGVNSIDYYRDDDDMHYQYWGPRLIALFVEVNQPVLQHRNAIWRWLEKRSGAEYVIMVTGVGVILTLVTLCVNIAQLRSDCKRDE